MDIHNFLENVECWRNLCVECLECTSFTDSPKHPPLVHLRVGLGCITYYRSSKITAHRCAFEPQFLEVVLHFCSCSYALLFSLAMCQSLVSQTTYPSRPLSVHSHQHSHFHIPYCIWPRC